MSHHRNKVVIHAIWTTQDRWPLITPEIEQIIYKTIVQEFHELECPVKIINGIPDHVHCLFELNPNKCLAQVLKQVKGSSSHFINQERLTSIRFTWQKGYVAYAVSPSQVKHELDYIANQKSLHESVWLTDELEQLPICA
ncbi:MAG: IS200/IS605 family transposase [Bacteroidetes bacterium]|jgi:putative transposase|nr:IS200/IS605 family transposase [Bacteroidota bacterium]